MTTLYKNINGVFHYWETWENDDSKSAFVHYGKVGEEGITETVVSDIKSNFSEKIEEMMESLEGYEEISTDDFKILIIEYKVEGFGTEEDLQKRYNIQNRMQGVLGWTGLGFCDGGSIGSDSMEVCCFVIDFETSKKVIEEDLKDTEYNDFSQIYLEE